jgi:PIN domain nuclease of toxin-antitoxin system
MQLLLDTHIWLWSHLEPERLSKKVARALEDDANELWLSPISTWEVMTLAANGRIELDPDVGGWIRQALAAVPIHEAPLSHDIALGVQDTGLRHRDPADRMLVATAQLLGLTMVTADDRIVKHAKVQILAS